MTIERSEHDKLWDAYRDGLEAAHRIGRYAGVTETPNCPCENGTPEHEKWWDGFGDGTEDLLAYRRSAD